MWKTHDYTHHYRGNWRDGGRCRIEIYAPAAVGLARRPMIVTKEPYWVSTPQYGETYRIVLT